MNGTDCDAVSASYAEGRRDERRLVRRDLGALAVDWDDGDATWRRAAASLRALLATWPDEEVLNETQMKVLRLVASAPNGQRQVGGDGMIGWRGSAESLVRRGLLNSWRSSYYAITDSGRATLAKAKETP